MIYSDLACCQDLLNRAVKFTLLYEQVRFSSVLVRFDSVKFDL